MLRLLVIADDFTGALDTGVQFVSGGAETRVITNADCDFKAMEESVQVLVLDAETRHLEKEKAYEAVFKIAQRAMESGIPYIYKKTDSALRGNIGAELKAVLDAVKAKSLHFFPAFPKMNRITKNGIHYIDGIPVHESVFGKDPFEPVLHSSIEEILGSDVNVTLVKDMDQWTASSGIIVYDACNDEELRWKGEFLKERDELHIMAGCAGFAGILPSLLGLEGEIARTVPLSPRFFIACGSVNPISKGQMDYAEKKGFARIHMTPEEKLGRDFYTTEMGRKLLEKWYLTAAQNSRCMIDTNDPDDGADTVVYAKKNQISTEQMRVRISMTLGYIVKELVVMGLDATLMIMGGDCLMGFMQHVGVDMIIPVCEVAPGTVLFQVDIGGRQYNMISKSGGFGGRQLLQELAESIIGIKGESICHDKRHGT